MESIEFVAVISTNHDAEIYRRLVDYCDKMQLTMVQSSARIIKRHIVPVYQISGSEFQMQELKEYMEKVKHKH